MHDLDVVSNRSMTDSLHWLAWNIPDESPGTGNSTRARTMDGMDAPCASGAIRHLRAR